MPPSLTEGFLGGPAYSKDGCDDSDSNDEKLKNDGNDMPLSDL